MKFCDECSSILTPNTSTGNLVFRCRCGKLFNSTPEDTLRFEEYMESSESKEKFQTFIDNSAFDPAGMKVNKTCKNCYMPYLTMIYVGNSETPLYTCVCGKKYTNKELE